MTEAADKGVTEPPTADKVAAASLPEAPPPADAPPPVYASVSILAIVGLCLAGLYALVIGLCGLVALFYHMPLILPIWTLAFPAAAAGVCWAAYTRVRNSEGALTGARLAQWGIGLAAVVGLLYAAYYGGSYFAVSGQATDFGNRWMDLLNKKQFDQAFLYTLRPPRPAEDEHLRDRLEMDFDRGERGHGLLSSFRESEILHQFEQGGGNAQVEFLGVQGWGYDKEGYSVVLRYRIRTDEMITEIVVTAVGADDPATGERQWYAKNPGPVVPPVMTEQGTQMELWSNQARMFGEEWLGRVAAGDAEQAFLGTLPPAARDDRTKERQSLPTYWAGVAALPGGAPAQGPVLEASALWPTYDLVAPFAERRRAFASGNVVQYQPDTFWVGPKETDPARDAARKELQAKMAGRVGDFFAADRFAPPEWLLTRALPTFHREGDLVRIGFDVEINLGSGGIRGRLWLTADVSQGVDKDQWRVESLELLSHKTGLGAPPKPPPPK